MEDRIAKESLMNDVNEDEILLEEKNNIIDSPYYEEYVAYREKYYKLRNQVTEGEELDENSNVRIAKDIYNVDDENVNTDEMKENIVSLPEKFFSTILYLIYYD